MRRGRALRRLRAVRSARTAGVPQPLRRSASIYDEASAVRNLIFT
jgi:hypothetical protein